MVWVGLLDNHIFAVHQRGKVSVQLVGEEDQVSRVNACRL